MWLYHTHASSHTKTAVDTGMKLAWNSHNLTYQTSQAGLASFDVAYGATTMLLAMPKLTSLNCLTDIPSGCGSTLGPRPEQTSHQPLPVSSPFQPRHNLLAHICDAALSTRFGNHSGWKIIQGKEKRKNKKNQQQSLFLSWTNPGH